MIVKPWSPGVWAGVCEAAGWGGGLGPTGEDRGCELSRGSVVTEPYYSTSSSHPGTPINTRDANHPSVFTITEKAPTRAGFSIVSYSQPSLIIIVSLTQFHVVGSMPV